MKAVGADDLGDTTEADNAHEDYSSAANPEEFKVDEDALDDSHAGSHLSQDDHLAEMMHAMDQELSKTHIGKSFASSERECGDGYDDPDVNVDLNLVESIVESFRAQEGLAGPAGTMLKQFGIHLPPNDSDVDSDEETG
ncbi:hypothetical protein GGI04_004254 [Coemansia thaxteri]|nr:hypothetical protein GGI04_004254 [Coemansia thaxteri]KAJ2473216.1 hypothetical protein GGI02_001013 [Coemansia sp. RSA 2322]